jgi:WD40 repeat protein
MWNGVTVTRTLRGVTAAYFAASGEKVVTIELDGFIKTWLTEDIPISQDMTEHGKRVNCMVAQPNESVGKSLASSSDDGTVRIWNTQTGLCEYILQDHVSGSHALAFSTDGSTLASGGGDVTILLWQTSKWWAPLQTFRGHSKKVLTISFGTNGAVVASAIQDLSVRVWNLDTETCSFILDILSFCQSTEPH